METVEKQWERLKPFQYKPGQSGNLNGRPEGSISLKQRATQYLRDHPDVAERFILEMIGKEKKFTWSMLEGSPPQSMSADIKGELKITRVSFDEYERDTNSL